MVTGGGVVLITKGDLSVLDNIFFAMGDLWMLSAAVIFAIYSILVKQKPKRPHHMGLSTENVFHWPLLSISDLSENLGRNEENP